MNQKTTAPTMFPEGSQPRYYCTLFDRNYLVRGLALYQSLDALGEPFHLYILCMDDVAAELLGALELAHATVIPLAEFETPELLAVKPERTIAEYCWTCAPCLLCHVIEHYPEVGLITYLDADLLFFSSAEPVYAEIGTASSAIVEHRFSEPFRHLTVNGKYNVQWVSIRRDEDGLQTLYWWRDRCIEWCFYRLEEGRMGDQKYLDLWGTLFKGVHDLQHLGAGVAPWNFANYRIEVGEDGITIDGWPLIFYHFHSFRMFRDGQYVAMPEAYCINDPVPTCIYDRYNEALLAALATVRTIVPDFSAGIEAPDDIPISRPTTRISGEPQVEEVVEQAPAQVPPPNPSSRVVQLLRRIRARIGRAIGV